MAFKYLKNLTENLYKLFQTLNHSKWLFSKIMGDRDLIAKDNYVKYSLLTKPRYKLEFGIQCKGLLIKIPVSLQRVTPRVKKSIRIYSLFPIIKFWHK